MKVYDAVSQRWVEGENALLADTLLDMKRKKPLWTVISYIVETWKKSNPSRYNSFLFNVKEKRQSRATKFGSNKNLTLRYSLDIPVKVYQIIRVLYSTDELKTDKKFLREFARRFPEFRIAEKL